MSFRLCSSYLENAARSLSALIALGAFVDITGTVYITSFVHADASKPIPEHLLETIIVTVPLVVFGYFLGTVIGMRMPIRVLLRLSIPIWIVYMPASLVVGLTAEAAGSVAKILKGDPGYRKDEDQD